MVRKELRLRSEYVAAGLESTTLHLVGKLFDRRDHRKPIRLHEHSSVYVSWSSGRQIKTSLAEQRYPTFYTRSCCRTSLSEAYPCSHANTDPRVCTAKKSIPLHIAADSLSMKYLPKTSGKRRSQDTAADVHECRYI